MFKHRRQRVACVLLVGWAGLAFVERWAEQTSWSRAVMHGLVWACVVAGTWWFAEMTQGRAARAGESRKRSRI